MPTTALTDTPPYRWVTDPADLQARLDAVLARPAPGLVGLDTEFMRERTYWPQLALVQLAFDDAGTADGHGDGDGEILLVDPLCPGMEAPLRRLLEAPGLTKVMHSAGEDLLALRQHCGTLPRPLFDTQIAAALSGVGAGLGYQRLVQAVLGQDVDKGETRSDWLRRPLSPAQLRYAAEDVVHLHAVYADLAARLQALGREAWCAEDCARLVDNADGDSAEPWPHLALRAAQFLDAAAQHRLLRLLRWRDVQARVGDRPRSWILDNELAVALARDPLPNAAAMQRMLDAHPKAPRKLAASLWQALETPLADETDAPLARVDDRDRKAYKLLQQAVADRSAALGLPDGVLASRRWLEALQDGEDWPGPLAGWRRGQLEPVLAPVLAAIGKR